MTSVGAMDIGEVAARSGLPASTLRYYDEKGLIRSVGRRGLRRLFDSNTLKLLEFIALARRSGFSLEEIAGMFTPDGRLRIDRAQLLDKANELDKSISQLTAMRDGLRHAARCSAPSHMECPKFQRLLRLASKRQVRDRTAAGAVKEGSAPKKHARQLRRPRRAMSE
jgi:DNA-binding transcriptional MerR regulator